MTDVTDFRTVDLGQAQRDLPELCHRIGLTSGRVEIAERAGPRCVLISKAELESLEHALAVLSDTESLRALRHDLAQLAVASKDAP